MRLFRCDVCGQVLYFENRRCEKCGHDLGYLPQANELVALEPEGETWMRPGPGKKRYRFCANAQYDACNWLVLDHESHEYCLACRHNRTVPDLSLEDNLLKWRRIEIAKHRLIYTLLRLGLPLETRDERPDGLGFDFLADQPDAPHVMTGHDDGLITLALIEANDAEREKRRTNMGEPYRTLLGHFRHEVGHYYWDRLVRDGGRLTAFRAMFGDERADYGEALKTHYANGAPADWQANFVSAYATAHPWEDFAETWTHYIHIVDTLEMAGSFGMSVRPRLDVEGELQAKVDFNPYFAGTIQQLIDAWLPITFALNNLNRSMGVADAYPFILSQPVIDKLGFIHALVHGTLPATDAAEEAVEPQAIPASDAPQAKAQQETPLKETPRQEPAVSP